MFAYDQIKTVALKQELLKSGWSKNIWNKLEYLMF